MLWGAPRQCWMGTPWPPERGERGGPVQGSALRGRTLPQEPVLFGTTIMENIRFGKPGASDAEVYAAAQLANADGFIRSFPEGYDTVVGMCRAPEWGTAGVGGGQAPPNRSSHPMGQTDEHETLAKAAQVPSGTPAAGHCRVGAAAMPGSPQEEHSGGGWDSPLLAWEHHPWGGGPCPGSGRQRHPCGCRRQVSAA